MEFVGGGVRGLNLKLGKMIKANRSFTEMYHLKHLDDEVKWENCWQKKGWTMN